MTASVRRPKGGGGAGLAPSKSATGKYWGLCEASLKLKAFRYTNSSKDSEISTKVYDSYCYFVTYFLVASAVASPIISQRLRRIGLCNASGTASTASVRKSNR